MKNNESKAKETENIGELAVAGLDGCRTFDYRSVRNQP